MGSKQVQEGKEAMVARGQPRETKTMPLKEMSPRPQKKMNPHVIKVQHRAPCSGSNPAPPAKTEPLPTVSHALVSEATTGTEVRGCRKQFGIMSCHSIRAKW